eukprot:CAMPEP_0201525672 /NCGR_PEP_ID=MMETSP0161_2-20130828/29121_1 /ASSEMBLY_ACC=CAM_ASM_000251 /TAXON_ID=180227 /ORGANISM="Neoparamoeba aestuarina, Strain SoJaBio B1-5/56/2" /LENGTH=165 /DNA_ID=CAMNT_0047925719 /DNA_START=54 /DNA_END=548 /DNA_ORIENTATION=-
MAASELPAASPTPRYGHPDIMSLTCEYEGYVKKRGRMFANWMKRYFILSDGWLFYYKQKVVWSDITEEEEENEEKKEEEGGTEGENTLSSKIQKEKESRERCVGCFRVVRVDWEESQEKKSWTFILYGYYNGREPPDYEETFLILAGDYKEHRTVWMEEIERSVE